MVNPKTDRLAGAPFFSMETESSIIYAMGGYPKLSYGSGVIQQWPNGNM